MAASITISEKAIAFLKSLKTDTKSYSEVIMDFQEARGSPHRVLRLVGHGKNDPNKKARDKNTEAFRRQIEQRFRSACK